MRPAILAAAVLLAGCASGPLFLGESKEGIVLDAEAAGRTAAESLAAAQRAAVESVLDLYLSSGARAQNAAALDARILGGAGGFIKAFKVVDSFPQGGGERTKIRALVLYPRLGLELERMGIASKAWGPAGPRVLLSLAEKVPADSLRRALAQRGFSVLDSSAPASVDAVIAGKAAAESVVDGRLLDFHPFRAEVALEVSTGPGSAPLAAIAGQATAVDLSPEGAAAKALENAGALAGEKAGAELSGRFGQRWEVETVVVGLKGVVEIKRFLAQARGVPEVRALWLESIAPPELRLRVSSTAEASEVASSFLRMRGWSFKLVSVEPDYLELEKEED